MITPPSGLRVLVATRPIGFRKGANGLAAPIRDEMRADPFSGVIYVLRAKRADRIKLLYWDGTGVVRSTSRYRVCWFLEPTGRNVATWPTNRPDAEGRFSKCARS